MSQPVFQAVFQASSEAESPGRSVAFRSPASVTARRPIVMICEDEPIIALDMQSRLIDMGFDVIGPYATQREAQRALRRSKPDMAIIDVELADGACTRLAAQLRDAGVYFAVLSGLTPSNPPPEFAPAPWLLKPLTDEALRNVIAGRPLALA